MGSPKAEGRPFSSLWSKAKLRAFGPSGCWGVGGPSGQVRLRASPGRLALTLCCQRRCRPRTRPASRRSPGP